MGPDEILRRCVFDHEGNQVISESHAGVARGHYIGKETMCKILYVGLWWPTIHMDTKIFVCNLEILQRIGKPLRHDEMPPELQTTLQAFNKWVIDFVGSISSPKKNTSTCYIITMKDYSTKWVEGAPIKDCTFATTKKILFENVVTRFVFPKIMLCD